LPETPKFLPLRVSRAGPDDGPAPGKRGSLASVDEGSEDAELILRERLELFFRSMFLVSLGFSVLALMASVSTGIATVSAYLTHPTNELHQVTNLVLLGGTLLFRFTRLSRPVLERIEPVLCVVVTSLFGSLFCLSHPAGRPELIAGMTMFTVCILRAVLIPSTTLRTLVVTAIAAAPAVAVAWIVHTHTTVVTGAGFPQNHASITLYAAIWWLVQVVVATLTTRVIYGLRQRVRRARQLGQYMLEKKLGEGGMGVVYRASHALLRRPTAVKLLVSERAGELAIQRFEREVRLTARLTHPNTVTIYDYGRTPEGVFYYAMELLDGIDLEQLVKMTGPMPPARACHILLQVAGALAEAHAIGLIHRDIKPANIMLCRQIGRADIAKLLDFGLVRELDSVDKTRSDVHTLTGTPLYMAPESIMNPRAVDGRADLYALAAVGYFLLVGAPVFEARTVVEVYGLHLHAPPVPPSERLGRPLPEGLERAILRGLAKKPEDRFPSAEAFAHELLLASEGVSWTPDEAQAWWATHVPIDSGSATVDDHLKSGQALAGADTGQLSVIGIDWRDR
jgi:tRNA A-37 threonylcarbamoyl transferase component Bud32